MVFYDTEHDCFVNEKFLKAEWEELRKRGETDAETFRQYVENCISKDGTLVPID